MNQEGHRNKNTPTHFKWSYCIRSKILQSISLFIYNYILMLCGMTSLAVIAQINLVLNKNRPIRRSLASGKPYGGPPPFIYYARYSKTYGSTISPTITTSSSPTHTHARTHAQTHQCTFTYSHTYAINTQACIHRQPVAVCQSRQESPRLWKMLGWTDDAIM